MRVSGCIVKFGTMAWRSHIVALNEIGNAS